MAKYDVTVIQRVRYNFEHEGTLKEVRDMIEAGEWPDNGGRVDKERLEVYEVVDGQYVRILDERVH